MILDIIQFIRNLFSYTERFSNLIGKKYFIVLSWGLFISVTSFLIGNIIFLHSFRNNYNYFIYQPGFFYKVEKFQNELPYIVKRTNAHIIVISIPFQVGYNFQGERKVTSIKAINVVSKPNISTNDEILYTEILSSDLPFIEEMTPENKCIEYEVESTITGDTKLKNILKVTFAKYIVRCALFTDNSKIPEIYITLVYHYVPSEEEKTLDFKYIKTIEDLFLLYFSENKEIK